MKRWWTRSGRTPWLLSLAAFLVVCLAMAGMAALWITRNVRRQDNDDLGDGLSDGDTDDWQIAVAFVPAPDEPSASSAASASTAGPTDAGPTEGIDGAGFDGRLVRDVMTPNPETIEFEADVATAAERMRSCDVGALPVVAGGQLAGMLTDRDLAMAMADTEIAPTTLQVGHLMSSVPVTVTADASLEEAAQLLADNQVRRLPVVEGSRLVGIISLTDLLASVSYNDTEVGLE